MTVSCNSLFYYPDSIERLTPAKLDHFFKEEVILTEDGLKLSAWIINPKAKARGSVLHFHGNAQNMTAHVSYSHWLANEGYEVITFDYRGYGKSDGKPDREGLVRDGRAAIRYAHSRNPSNLFIFAQSLGGAIAIPALVSSGVDSIRAIILESTFGSYRRLVRKKIAGFWLTWLFQWPASLLVSDHLCPEDIIPSVTIPMLLIHGDRDPVVPISEGRALYEAATNSERELWELEHFGHTGAFLNPKSPYRSKLITYLCAHSFPKRQCTLINSTANP